MPAVGNGFTPSCRGSGDPTNPGHRSAGGSLPDLFPRFFLQGTPESEALLGEEALIQSCPCAQTRQLCAGESNHTLEHLQAVFLIENIFLRLSECTHSEGPSLDTRLCYVQILTVNEIFFKFEIYLADASNRYLSSTER